MLDLEKRPALLFSGECKRIANIQAIQKDLTANNVDRLEMKIQFLNQAYLFQLVAFWQVFVGELARYTFREIAAVESGGTLQQVANQRLESSLKNFNTPNWENIDRLFEEGLGIEAISKNWTTAEMKFESARLKLRSILSTRHRIAHLGYAKSKLSYETNFEEMETLVQLAELTESAVLRHIEECRKTASDIAAG